MRSRFFAFILSLCLFVSHGTLVFAAEDDLAVSAEAAVLMEVSTGEIVYARNRDERLPMASTTKIMTALVAIENSALSTPVTVNTGAVGVEGSSVYLVPGEVLTMEDLLYSLMLESANDAAAAIAYAIGGSIEGFAEMMNGKAISLGLSDTHYTNPHGLDDPAHYTTAADLARLTAYALHNPDFARIVSTYRHTIPMQDGDGVRVLVNHNRLLKQCADIVGVKTGFTRKSGRCLVSAAKQNGVELVAVTLNAPNDWQDHRTMLDYGFTRFAKVTLAEKGAFVSEIPCVGAPDGFVAVCNTDTLSIVLRDHPHITHVIEAPHILFAPIHAGDICGTVRFFADGTEVGSLPLVACTDVSLPDKKPGFFAKLFGTEIE